MEGRSASRGKAFQTSFRFQESTPFAWDSRQLPMLDFPPRRRPAVSKRELLTPQEGDSRYARRDQKGQFAEQDDVGKSLKQDRAKKAKTVVKPGQGDRGDQKK
jgi:hypothetical protein